MKDSYAWEKKLGQYLLNNNLWPFIEETGSLQLNEEIRHYLSWNASL